MPGSRIWRVFQRCSELFLKFSHEFPDELLILGVYIRELDALAPLTDPGHDPDGVDGNA